MKKIIATVCLLLALTMIFVSCSGKKETETVTSESTSKAEYLDVEKLYFYESLYELLKENQEPVPMGRFNTHTEYMIPLYESNPQIVMHKCGKCATYSDRSIGYPFADICTEMNANPFSNFNMLVEKEWIVPSESETEKNVVFDFTDSIFDCFGLYMEYNNPRFSVNKKFEYSEEGCRDYYITVAALEKSNVNTQTFIALPSSSAPEINYSAADECFYSFIINYDSSNAYITALYFRSDDGEYITDVTAQVMCAEFPYGDFSAGSSLSSAGIAASEELGKMAFFMALEQTLSGECLFSEPTVIHCDSHDIKYIMPAEYEGKGYTAKINAKQYVSAKEYHSATEDEPESFPEIFDIYTYSVKLK